MAAADDLEGIAGYLHLHHPSFEAETIRRINDTAKSLKRFPFIGREGKISGTRELVLAPLPYLIVYSVDDLWVHLLRILHTSRDRQ
jgi:toxin ParE1/3/4